MLIQQLVKVILNQPIQTFFAIAMYKINKINKNGKQIIINVSFFWLWLFYGNNNSNKYNKRIVKKAKLNKQIRNGNKILVYIVCLGCCRCKRLHNRFVFIHCTCAQCLPIVFMSKRIVKMKEQQQYECIKKIFGVLSSSLFLCLLFLSCRIFTFRFFVFLPLDQQNKNRNKIQSIT